MKILSVSEFEHTEGQMQRDELKVSCNKLLQICNRIQTDRQTDRQTDTQTHRQTDTQTDTFIHGIFSITVTEIAIFILLPPQKKTPPPQKKKTF